MAGCTKERFRTNLAPGRFSRVPLQIGALPQFPLRVNEPDTSLPRLFPGAAAIPSRLTVHSHAPPSLDRNYRQRVLSEENGLESVRCVL